MTQRIKTHTYLLSFCFLVLVKGVSGSMDYGIWTVLLGLDHHSAIHGSSISYKILRTFSHKIEDILIRRSECSWLFSHSRAFFFSHNETVTKERDNSVNDDDQDLRVLAIHSTTESSRVRQSSHKVRQMTMSGQMYKVSTT